MTTVKVGARRDVRIPREAARALRLRPGTRLEVMPLEDGIVLVPAGRIRKDQRYFWTEEWQKKEREADEALARGETVGPFDDAEEAIRALRDEKV